MTTQEEYIPDNLAILKGFLDKGGKTSQYVGMVDGDVVVEGVDSSSVTYNTIALGSLRGAEAVVSIIDTADFVSLRP
ncbi:MAG: hypothetical protein WAV41_03110 [Microgenomates group bacterium]